MNVTICSIFRNSESYLPRYLKQIEDMSQSILNVNFHCIWGEGDSTDNTKQILTDYESKLFTHELIDVTHGGSDYGSIINETRFENCAFAGNKVWELIKPNADIVAYIDSDIIWDCNVLSNLLFHMYYVDCVVPLVLLNREGWPKDSFYNTYDFRINGTRFTHKLPYHTNLEDHDNSLCQLDSAGSFLVMKGEVARQVKFSSTEVIIGMCNDICKLDYDIWLDPTLQVTHE